MWKQAIAGDLREKGSAWGKGVREGQPPGGGKDKQSVLNKGRGNMGKDKEDQSSRT